MRADAFVMTNSCRQRICARFAFGQLVSREGYGFTAIRPTTKRQRWRAMRYPGSSVLRGQQTGPAPAAFLESCRGLAAYISANACRFMPARAHFRCPSMRETSAEVGDKFWSAVGATFGARGTGLFAVELIMGGALFIGALLRTRLPLRSRVFEMVCAMAAALKQNTKSTVRTAFVIALILKFPEGFAVCTSRPTLI
jgi:hypothetical protein